MKQIGRILFALYALLMLWLLFGQRIGQDGGGVNLIPFATAADFLRLLAAGQNVRHAVINLAGNIVMFVPPGLLLPLCSASMRRFGRCMAVCTAGIVCVELMQLLTRLGVCDIDDLILNLIGAAMGYGIWWALFGKRAENKG